MHAFEPETINEIKNLIHNELNNESILMSKVYKEEDIFPKKEFDIVKIDNITKIEENRIAAFVPVEKYNFYLSYLINLNTPPDVEFVNCTPGISVNYSIICDDINEMLNTITIIPTKIVRKGEMLANKLVSKNNHVEFYNDTTPDYFHKKMEKLESFFSENSTDFSKIVEMGDDRNIWIDVCFNYKYGLSDISVELESLPTLKDLNMTFVFDIYAEGSFKNE